MRSAGQDAAITPELCRGSHTLLTGIEFQHTERVAGSKSKSWTTVSKTNRRYRCVEEPERVGRWRKRCEYRRLGMQLQNERCQEQQQRSTARHAWTNSYDALQVAFVSFHRVLAGTSIPLIFQHPTALSVCRSRSAFFRVRSHVICSVVHAAITTALQSRPWNCGNPEQAWCSLRFAAAISHITGSFGSDRNNL